MRTDCRGHEVFMLDWILHHEKFGALAKLKSDAGVSKAKSGMYLNKTALTNKAFYKTQKLGNNGVFAL